MFETDDKDKSDKSGGKTKRKRSLPIAMTMKEAEAIAGALGHPSKMPGYSYGISATKCQTGSKLRNVPGSVCSGCYAMTDWYRSWRPLLHGHARRWAGLHHPRWVDAMVAMITQKCQPPDDYFRWHDSGDLQGIWHLDQIAAVCARTPEVSHWLPTREYEFVAGYLATGKKLPSNLTVRLSAHMIDSEPVVPPELAHLPTSTVSSVSSYASGVRIVEGKHSIECRAVSARNNVCGPCRACWSSEVACVQYPQH
jgi:hypothetical protein